VGYENKKNNDYDLVLCDIKCRKMDGVNCFKKIKPEIPIV
jgi:CheY-like chemotaxis protein